MITLTITETRPNLDVVFYRVPADFINYIQKYNDIRHREIFGWTTSPDLLTRTSTCTFDSQADADTYLNDPVVQNSRIAHLEYNTANGITGNVTVV